MPPVICIVGRPKSGKTTLITRLIPELKDRGYRVATIKHTSHDFETDIEGKDSFKHTQAGSECVVVSSASKVSLVRKVDRDLGLSELVNLIPDEFDIVLAEGFKRASEPKIEVHRQGMGPLVGSSVGLLAVVTDEPLNIEAPQFPPDDISALCDLIEKKFPA